MSFHENLVVIDVSPITVMTGAVTMDSGDIVLGKGGSILPSECRAANGRKYFMQRNVLNKLNSCRNRLVRYLEGISVHYLGGYAAPLSKRSEILAVIDKETKAFNSIKHNELLAQYDRWVNDWCNQFPEYATQLKNSAPSIEKVKERNQFAVNVFQVKPLEGEAEIAEDSNLGEKLFKEVNKEARKLYNDSFRGKTECTRKAVSALERMAQKLQGLAFLDNRALPLFTEVQKRISKLPKHGPYKGNTLTEISNIVLLLAMEIDLVYEKGLVEKAAAEGINLLDTGTSEPVMVCGVPNKEEAKEEIPTGPDLDTSKTSLEEPLTPNVPQGQSESKVHQKELDLFADLDAMFEKKEEPVAPTTQKVPEEIKPQSVNTEEEADDYFSDQFEFA